MRRNRSGVALFLFALLLLTASVGCGPRLLALSFQPLSVRAGAPPPPPPAPVLRVQVAEKMIRITERVEFETDSAKITDAALKQCVLTQAQTIQLTRPSFRPVRVTFPLIFSPN